MSLETRPTCSAIGCRVNTKSLFCGPHYRLLSKEDRNNLERSGYYGQSVIDAIEVIAKRERKDMGLIEYQKLCERFGAR